MHCINQPKPRPRPAPSCPARPQASHEDKDSGQVVSAVDCYFMCQDGSMFKARVLHAPYFYLQVKVRGGPRMRCMQRSMRRSGCMQRDEAGGGCSAAVQPCRCQVSVLLLNLKLNATRASVSIP
jgi:hypothetical protein